MRRVFLLLQLLLCPIVATARVISYSPYTSEVAVRGYQDRTTRHFVLSESPSNNWAGYRMPSKVVLYDSTGAEAPRVIFPQAGSATGIDFTALYERPGRDPVILVIPETGDLWISRNAGRTWRRVTELAGLKLQLPTDVDRGGPWTNGLSVPVRIGSGQYPFVVAFDKGIYAISANGAPKLLFGGTIRTGSLLGQNREGTEFLILGDRAELVAVTLDGKWRGIGVLAGKAPALSGWLAPDGSAYVVRQPMQLQRYVNGRASAVLSTPYQSSFAVPTYDFNGAWILEHEKEKITILSRYTPATGLKTMWEDKDAPQVEALHAGASGKTLLLQVHRDRAKQDLKLLDPALAVWHVGEPAPAAYDELFLNEAATKGFVHLDVEKAAMGEPFVFDSGFERPIPPPPPPISSPPGPSGGGDVVQEWGVVRASLEQRLVLIGMTRNAEWQSDLVVYNPADEPQSVRMTYGEAKATIELDPKEIRVIADALSTLFDVDEGTGTIHVFPAFGVNILARVHSGPKGYAVQAVDYFNVSSPRFPVTFAGAKPGPEFHSDLILADTSSQGIDASVQFDTTTTSIQSEPDELVEAPAGGAAIVRPLRGALIAGARAIDERTGDGMYFPPDLPASSIRTIPLVAHVENKGVPVLVSDLYLLNLSSSPRDVIIEAKLYEGSAWPQQRMFFLKPYETRVLADPLKTLFNYQGRARLRYWSYSWIGDAGVRVASRTYTPASGGGSYGTAVPPLNAFQSATGGESLEILGATQGSRVSLGLLELSGSPRFFGPEVQVSIVDDHGNTLGSFTTEIYVGSGEFTDDVFARAKVSQPAAARIVVKTLDDHGLVGAYAILTDPTTGDPTYLGAQLGAKSK